MVYGQIFTLSSDIIFLSDGITFTTDIRHLIFGQIFPDHHSARIRMVARLFWGEFHFEDIKFPVTIRDIHKIAKKNPITISVFDYENKEKNIKSMCQKKTCWFIIDRRKMQKAMFLSKILIHSCMIIHYIAEENIFAVIIYHILVQKNY